jgi:mRNA degradation ribonuclease J1/J2
MSRGEYRHLHIGKGDTVIVSATPIPGNEKMIQRTLDNLFRLGADVFYDELWDVHVSGHGSRKDLQKLIELVQPEYFIPIHGEYRQLVHHSRLAREAGMSYAIIAHVTDYDVWHESLEPVTVEMVIKTLLDNAAAAQQATLNAIQLLKDAPPSPWADALQDAIITDRSKIPQEQEGKHQLLIGKYL